MKTKKLMIYAILACLSFVLFSGCKGRTASESSSAPVTTQVQPAERGAYLVATVGCHDCHSPKKMGQQGPELIQDRLLSGYQADNQLPPINKAEIQKGWILFNPDLTCAVGFWGISYSANITSDPSGIGSWPEENFLRAMKEGKYKGIETGRTLLPPMPWQNFANMNDDDVKAIYAYLKSTKPVDNVVPMALAMDDIK